MKKLLLNLASGVILSAFALSASAQDSVRYVNDIFADVLVQSNIEYDSNRSINILYGQIPGQLPIITVKLKCDVYTPAGDAATNRPVVIIAGTGSYLPAILNNQTTGSKKDSSVVELCKRFAMKGYVAVAVDYRQGWNPLTTVQADAAEQLIKATYRALQDVRNCIRFLRSNASTYGIDTSKIVVGGQGTGGYVALALASVNTRAELESNPKFQRGDFSPMIDVDTLGDWMGAGGVQLPGYPFYFNYGGDAGVAANAHLVFHYGGAIGDSTWVDNATLPTIGIQSTTDLFAPYKTGNVVVPTTGLTVIPSASGAGALIPYINSMGLNAKINAYTYTDVYSTRAMSASGNVGCLFPLYTQVPGDGAPWEWWDRPTVQAITNVPVNGLPIPTSGHKADSLSMLTNPLMSAAKGKAYIDTIVNFVAPRIAVQFNFLVAGVEEKFGLNDVASVYPNPAANEVTVQLPVNIRTVELTDITGKALLTEKVSFSNQHTMNLTGINQGIYMVQITALDGRTAVKRLIIN
ncbi:MAG: T9SS type A sorting domain-containing protein [Bacteroidia bacterium]|jgi:hypothetical protein